MSVSGNVDQPIFGGSDSPAGHSIMQAIPPYHSGFSRVFHPKLRTRGIMRRTDNRVGSGRPLGRPRLSFGALRRFVGQMQAVHAFGRGKRSGFVGRR